MTLGFKKMMKYLEKNNEPYELVMYDPNKEHNPCSLLNKLKHWGDFSSLTYWEYYEMKTLEKKKETDNIGITSKPTSVSENKTSDDYNIKL